MGGALKLNTVLRLFLFFFTTYKVQGSPDTDVNMGNTDVGL